MPHIPDKWYAFAVAKTYYRELIEAGVNIYEFTPGFVHAKVFVSDDEDVYKRQLQYQIEVDTKQKEAHQIKVEPTYMPEGYEYQEEGPYGGKWHNKETNSGISIIPYNAAELYKMSRVDEDSFRKFRKESRVKTSDTENTKLDLFLMDSEYVDSEKTEKMLYLFNEEEGYGIYIHNTSDLPDVYKRQMLDSIRHGGFMKME